MGYTSNPQLITDSTTDANFRAWGSAISGQMSAAGLTLQDTNINWTTVTSPAQNTSAGYETWKTADSLSSTFPLYIKLEYGTSNNVTKGSALRVSFGTGNAGGGTLTGNTAVMSTSGAFSATNGIIGNSSGAGTGSTTWDCYFSSDGTGANTGGARFGALLFRNHATNSTTCAFGWERNLDANGNYLAGYWTVWAFSNNAGGSNMWFIFPVGIGTTYQPVNWSNTTGQSFPTIGTISTVSTWLLGTTTAFTPYFPIVGRIDNPLTCMIAVLSGDQQEGFQFAATMYGQTHNYVFTKAGACFGGAGSGSAGGSGANNNLRWAMRYD